MEEREFDFPSRLWVSPGDKGQPTSMCNIYERRDDEDGVFLDYRKLNWTPRYNCVQCTLELSNNGRWILFSKEGESKEFIYEGPFSSPLGKWSDGRGIVYFHVSKAPLRKRSAQFHKCSLM